MEAQPFQREAQEPEDDNKRYWPSNEEGRELVSDGLNALIAHIAAYTDDPAERDALARFAGDQLRHHLAHWQGDAS